MEEVEVVGGWGLDMRGKLLFEEVKTWRWKLLVDELGCCGWRSWGPVGGGSGDYLMDEVEGLLLYSNCTIVK
jgi:hypothetical protein